MKKIIVLILFFLFYNPVGVSAQLQSNYVDPGMLTNRWKFREDPTNCSSGVQLPVWDLHSFAVFGTPCTGPAYQNWYQLAGGAYAATLSLNNTLNTQQMCSYDRVYYGLQPAAYATGVKRILYYPNLSELRVKVKIKNDSTTSACDDPAIPECASHFCSTPDPEGKVEPYSSIVIGIPMYDETNSRNLWLEIVPFWTAKAIYSQPVGTEFKFPESYLFWGESPREELHRIMVTHPLLNLPAINPGETASYDIDVLPIIKSLGWGRSNVIDWNKVHFDGAYVGVETRGWTLTTFDVSGFDLLYDTKPPPKTIFDLRSLLRTYTSIFGYTNLISKFGGGN